MFYSICLRIIYEHCWQAFIATPISLFAVPSAYVHSRPLITCPIMFECDRFRYMDIRATDFFEWTPYSVTDH